MKAVQRTPVSALALLLGLLLPAAAGTGPKGPKVAEGPLSVPRTVALPQTVSIPALPSAAGALPGAAMPALPAAHAAAAFPKIQAGLPSAAPASAPAAPHPSGATESPLGQAPFAGLPQSAGIENAARISSELSADNLPKLSGEQAADAASRFIDPREAGGNSLTVQVSDSFGAGRGASLAPWQRKGGPWSWIAPEAGVAGQPAPASPTRPTLKERGHYRRLWAENLWFYVFTNIVNKWGPYSGDWARLRASGVTPPVSKPRKFFAHMRVMGQTGEFYVPGFTPRHDQKVLEEARETFIKYFDGPGVGDKERAAFESFLQRAMAYNVERRAASKFRAHVRDSMLKASVMDPAKIASFFDGLPVVTRTAEFQAGAADAILAEFQKVVLEEVAKEPKDAKDRITGIILIGSFALGAATPTSDFDVEPITADGGSGRVKGFSDRLTARWKEVGRQQTNPVTFHMFGYLNSRWELRAIHHEPYLIISPDQAIVANLAMRPGEPSAHVPSRDLKPFGRFLRWAQYAAVYLTSLLTPAK